MQRRIWVLLGLGLCLLPGLLGCGGAGSGGSASGGSGSGGSGGGGGGGTPPPTAPPPVTIPQATRLLDQATFGPTTADVAHVQQVGLSGYVTEQLSASQTVLPSIPATLPAQCVNDPRGCFESEFWQASLTAPDQLRQRVAFALSEIWVTSTQPVSGRAMVPYYNTLSKDAFGNWRTLMEDVTLSPAMGLYLDMLNSNKPPAGQIANENYGREMLQLFSTGLVMLNSDGSEQKDAAGNTIPVYTEAQVEAFARVYTGWTYASSTGGVPAKFPNGTVNYDAPMAAVETAHDMTSKTLLNGVMLSAGQSSAQDLKGALDNIFQHPNLPPFVCRQLIQHLVTSTPSPAYVARVSAVFVNNGSGVRGDMKAVLTAILLDSEARAGDSGTFDGGHLREPILYMTAVMRALGYTSTNTDATNLYAYSGVSNYTSPLSEIPLRSPSVFNFFPPEYVIPGSALNAPEFSLENTASVQQRLTLADQLSENRVGGFTANLTATGTLGQMASNAGTLVDALGVLFLHGQMPGTMRSNVVNAVSGYTDLGQRVRVATYLVVSSSEYKVMH